MTNREAIEQLKATAPQVRLSRGQQAARIVGWVCSGVAVMALTVSVYATRQASQVSTCINTTLGIRQQFSDADHANERQKIADQAVAENTTSLAVARLLGAKTPAEKTAAQALYTLGVTQFSQSLANWTARDKKIAAQRAQHPLGRC